MRAEPVAGWSHECVVARCRVSEIQTPLWSVSTAGGSGSSPNYPTPTTKQQPLYIHRRCGVNYTPDRRLRVRTGKPQLYQHEPELAPAHGRDYMATTLPAQGRNARASFKKLNATTQRKTQPRASVRACWRTAAPEGRKSAFPVRVASGRPASLEAVVPCQCTSSYELEECEESC